MTRCRTALEKRIGAIREEHRAFSRRVANRLLGVRRYSVLRTTSKHPYGWIKVKTFSTREAAEQFARSMRAIYWLVEEIVE